MMRAGRRRVLIALALAPGVLRAQPSAVDVHLQPLGDLRALADSIAKHKAPLLVLFSTPGCPFCREVRRNYLAPRVKEQAGKTTPDLLMRETDITSANVIVDLAGTRITEADFARQHNVRAVPVVMLFSASLRPIGEPLVGLDRSGFYEGYLASVIDAARKHLRQTS
ncbi:MAG: thioredoxin family protein [Burkholderiaceae bacterium]